MKKVFLISDTHGHIEPAFEKHILSCDEIWHAGDVGSPELIDYYRTLKPFKGVYGNIDGFPVRRMLPAELYWEEENVKFYLTHIAGPFGKYRKEVRKKIQDLRPEVLLCGHTHILKVQYDHSQHLLYLNPGAAGNYGPHLVKTAISFQIHKGKIDDLRIIEIKRNNNIDSHR